MNAMFVSYAFQDLPQKKIKKCEEQYHDVDMTALLGADEDNFPFLVRFGSEDFSVMIWSTYNGFMEHIDEDLVRDYATVQYLLNRGYPVFASMTAAQKWAVEHDWPRKQRATNAEVQ